MGCSHNSRGVAKCKFFSCTSLGIRLRLLIDIKKIGRQRREQTLMTMGPKLQLLPTPEIVFIFIFPRCNSPLWGRASSRWHSDTPHSVGLLWTNDQPVANNSTWQHTTQTPMPPAGFEPVFPASESPQSYTLNSAVTGTGGLLILNTLKYIYDRTVQQSCHHLKERRSVHCTAAGIEELKVRSVYHFHYRWMNLSLGEKKLNIRRKGVIITRT